MPVRGEQIRPTLVLSVGLILHDLLYCQPDTFGTLVLYGILNFGICEIFIVILDSHFNFLFETLVLILIVVPSLFLTLKIVIIDTILSLFILKPILIIIFILLYITIMGNLINKIKKNKANANPLSKSLLHQDLIEKMIYLENKLDFLDDKLFVMEAHTQANIKILSSDVHQLHQRMIDLKK
jgi:hypothetical protein